MDPSFQLEEEMSRVEKPSFIGSFHIWGIIVGFG